MQKREIADFDRQHAANEKKIEDAIAKMLQPAPRVCVTIFVLFYLKCVYLC